MEIKYLYLEAEKREKILNKIKTILEGDENIILAFVHGSFLFNAPFRDIDIALFLKDKEKAFEYVVHKNVKLEKEIGLPIDIHVLNDAPVSFKYNVITRGKLLFTRNKTELHRFIEKTLKEYWDLKMLIKYSSPDSS